MLYSGPATTELPRFPNLRNIIGPRNVYFKNVSQMILINAHGLLSRCICDDILRQPFPPRPLPPHPPGHKAVTDKVIRRENQMDILVSGAQKKEKHFYVSERE